MCVLGFQYERAASPLAATPLTAYRSGDAAYIRAAGPLELRSGVAAHYLQFFVFCSMRPQTMLLNASPSERRQRYRTAMTTAMHCNDYRDENAAVQCCNGLIPRRPRPRRTCSRCTKYSNTCNNNCNNSRSRLCATRCSK